MTGRFKELYAYNTWANRRVYEAAGRLTPSQCTQPIVSSFPSMIETLKHILAAEWIWLSRWKGQFPKGMPAEWNDLSLDQLARAWEANDVELRTFVDGLTETDLDRELTYQSLAGKTFTNSMSEMLTHLVNHSTYHRGQITTMLRQLGAETVSTDMILFYRETKKPV